MATAMARATVLLVALISIFSSDLCRAASNPSVLFFAEDALGPSDQDAGVISSRGLAATAAVLLGLPTPSTTDASVAKEISGLVSKPLSFSRADRLLILTIEGAPSVPSDWLQGVSLGGQSGNPSSPSMKLVHARTLAAAKDDAELTSVRRELALMSRESGAAMTSEWPSEAAPNVGEAAWDSAVLGGAELGTSEEASAAAARNLLGQEFVSDVLEVSELVQGSRDRNLPPALLSRTLTVPAVEAGKEKAALKGLEGALAAVLSSLQKSKGSSSAPLVAVVILKGRSAAALQQPGCQEASCGARGSHARVLVETEPESALASAQQVVENSVYVVVILVLLTAFLIGIVLLCGMHVTKDTLLYSGAKLD